jgi:hypothetical protein
VTVEDARVPTRIIVPYVLNRVLQIKGAAASSRGSLVSKPAGIATLTATGPATMYIIQPMHVA